MQWVRKHNPDPEEDRLFRQALWITLLGNAFLAVGKGAVAFLSGSTAIYADAANSVSDFLYSLMMILGLWMARRPPDLSHPQGHSRYEPLVGLGIMLSMFFAGFEAARTSITRFIEGGMAIEPGLPAIALVISVLIKAGMFTTVRNLANRLSNPTLATAAKDNLSDVLTTTGAFIGALGSKLLFPIMDPLAGILVSLWIFRNAISAGIENLGYLTGRGATEEVRQKIVAAAESIPGVLRVHQALTEYVGPRLIADLHININGHMTLEEAHEISDQVIEKLESLEEVDRAYIHVEPPEEDGDIP